jgi:hypothetical protein
MKTKSPSMKRVWVGKSTYSRPKSGGLKPKKLFPKGSVGCGCG